jgi:hypothetical protein
MVSPYKHWLTPHLILVLCIHVFRVADLTHVAEVRAVDIMVGVFDGRLKINNAKSCCKFVQGWR